MEREAFGHLLVWKKSKNRKPLVLRGARQVGKTTLVNQFAKTYKQYVYLNLERPSDLKYFEEFDNVKDIVASIHLNAELEADYNNTLLFIDEIQESPKAIALLRYFAEDLPDLHVISAGSLLEFALNQVKNFPVGRIQYLYLFPLNFREFLLALGKKNALKALDSIPLSDTSFEILMGSFRKYAIIGGMPEVVKNYLEKENFAGLHHIYESIWTTYKNDVRKYAQNATEEKVIFHIMNSACNYLDERVTFQNFGNSNYRSREVGEAFRSLDDAKVIQIIYPTTELTFPIKTDYTKKPRLQFLDSGLVNYDLKIQHELIALSDLSEAYRGALVPHIITQELISLNRHHYEKPHFWVREKKQSSAEVDLVYYHEGKVIPIEIKSGKIGKLRSLHQFMDQCPHHYAVRIYAGKFEVLKIESSLSKPFFLMNLPYFLGTKIPEYLNWFTENY
jgi:predicted AAA+ superfamily ATPase